ncbi:MAG: ATP-binding protein [Caldilineaceae bacterium]|nr:ATP-binding protein [Caldilineaceae bacterium]MDE0337673.1 ATP-binding protein [Caldilineaceae bacterium]
MDPIRNPYAPGAGTRPPAMVGRDELREAARIALERIRLGRPSKSIVMVGLRGVGKTVLLDQIAEDAEASGLIALRIEASEQRSLPSMIAPQLRSALIRLSNREAVQAPAQRALRALAGFASSLKVKYQDIEVGFDADPEPGLADNGDLGTDLQDLFEAVGVAAKADNSCVALFVDELQYVEKEQLAALITALHRDAQRQLPVTMVGAGLPQLRGAMGNAKSYAERLFDFPEVGPLSSSDARIAISKPARDEGVEIEAEVLDAVVSRTQGYPYFLQVWGKHLWDVAEDSPITEANFIPASARAIADLDQSFFLVRFDRLTPSQKKYLRAMAELGAGPHRSGDIAQVMERAVTSLGPTRAQLINKGMIWSPGHGDTAFTVPMFNEFMLRIVPNLDL